MHACVHWQYKNGNAIKIATDTNGPLLSWIYHPNLSSPWQKSAHIAWIGSITSSVVGPGFFQHHLQILTTMPHTQCNINWQSTKSANKMHWHKILSPFYSKMYLSDELPLLSQNCYVNQSCSIHLSHLNPYLGFKRTQTVVVVQNSRIVTSTMAKLNGFV